MFNIKVKTTVRTVRKDQSDGLYYVYSKSVLGSWNRVSHGFQHPTSAWAHLGKLTAKEQSADSK